MLRPSLQAQTPPEDKSNLGFSALVGQNTPNALIKWVSKINMHRHRTLIITKTPIAAIRVINDLIKNAYGRDPCAATLPTAFTATIFLISRDFSAQIFTQ